MTRAIACARGMFARPFWHARRSQLLLSASVRGGVREYSMRIESTQFAGSMFLHAVRELIGFRAFV